MIGGLPVDAVDAVAIQRVLAPIWLAKGETARRVRQQIGVVLDYAHGKGWRDTEAPMRAVTQLLGGLKQPKGSHFAAMPYKALPDFLAALRDGEFSIGATCASVFLVLTAARSGEVRKARWKDIDLEAAEWRLPPANTKTGKWHIVPLVPRSTEILRQIRDLLGSFDDDLVFPGLNGMIGSTRRARRTVVDA